MWANMEYVEIRGAPKERDPVGAAAGCDRLIF
jgi:hypothetical protein